jgi:hypothetical protein
LFQTPVPYQTMHAGDFDAFITGNFNNGSSSNASLTAMLEGAWNGTTMEMNTDLNAASLLPNDQPYNNPPWRYAGMEHLSVPLPSDIVDWVLVELRTRTDASFNTVIRHAGVIDKNGNIFEPDGYSPFGFSELYPGYCYVSVYHRNHLPIMTAGAQYLAFNIAGTYDFTTSMNQAFSQGSNPMKQLATGIYGMFAGDGNADGGIDSPDYTIWWQDFYNQRSGYLASDFDMNGAVQTMDYYMWFDNNGSLTQIMVIW